MKYNFDEDEIKKMKEQIESITKEKEGFLMSQQYHKAIKAKEKQEELEAKIQERRSKKNIPRTKRMHITGSDIQKIVEQMTGVPESNLDTQDIIQLGQLGSKLKKRIIDQNEAIDSVVNAIKRSRTGISDVNRPMGSFLFLGPTGVGKTELVKVLAEEFYGDPKALIKIDMSEFNERSSASKLIGTTAGYVGYEEGGMLTEKVRRKPYSVVLFDEIEKGNFEVFNLLLQILEDGVITDGKGRKVNFKNTIIIMTSNLGAEEFTNKAAQIGFNLDEKEENKIIKDFEAIKTRIIGDLDEFFAPEFINRIDKILVFAPLDTKSLGKIIKIQLERLVDRLQKVGVTLTYDPKVIPYIQKETYDPAYGARPVRRFIQEKIEDSLAELLLSKQKPDTIAIHSSKNGLKFTPTRS